MPKPKLSSKELARLKSTFRAADCTVRDLKGTSFEIFHAELPLRSHVFKSVLSATGDDADGQAIEPAR